MSDGAVVGFQQYVYAVRHFLRHIAAFCRHHISPPTTTDVQRTPRKKMNLRSWTSFLRFRFTKSVYKSERLYTFRMVYDRAVTHCIYAETAAYLLRVEIRYLRWIQCIILTTEGCPRRSIFVRRPPDYSLRRVLLRICFNLMNDDLNSKTNECFATNYTRSVFPLEVCRVEHFSYPTRTRTR